MGAHVASIVLDDYEASALFCRAGLVSHPDDPQLENNLAYALALAGRTDEAVEVLNDVVKGQAASEATEISLLATRGLAAFRTGLFDRGRLLYQEAIEAASRTTVAGLAHLAVLNYAREELIAGTRLAPALQSELRALKVDSGLVTLSIFKDKILAMLDSADRPRGL
jgi:tetratricopeptide (TPR) repeat protein